MLLLWLAVGVVAHEAAHYLAARALGLNARLVPRRGLAVAYWSGDGETVRVGRRDRALVSAAGPAANVLLAVLVPGALLPNVLLAVLNLVPVRGSDGWKILEAARERPPAGISC